MQALTVSDLQVLAEEPRVRDLDLAKRLGFRRPRAIRQLIERSLPELGRYGTCHTAWHVVRGNEVTEYLLNEPQALLVCIKSDAPSAADVREQIIRVFMAWRHGRLAPPPAETPPQAALPPAPYDPIATALQLKAGRLVAADLLGRVHADTDPAVIADQLRELDIWSHGMPGRRPRWFWNAEVVEAAYLTYRRNRLDVVQADLVARFGAAAPSRSALHRFWQRLDGLKHRGLPQIGAR